MCFLPPLALFPTEAGWAGYPMPRLMALCETGTGGLLGAVFGPTSEYETTCAQRLLPLLTPRMPLSADRGFDGDAFLQQIADTDAQFLIRPSHRRPSVLAVLPDGSGDETSTSTFCGVPVPDDGWERIEPLSSVVPRRTRDP